MSMNSKKEPAESYLSNRLLILVLIFSVLGGVLSLYATGLTFRFTTAGLIEPSACSFSDLFTCDTVLSTSYAKMFGVPVAWFGFMYFLWVFFVSVFALINRRKQSGVAAIDIIIFVTSAAVLITLMKALQLISLGVLCPVCAGMYVCVFVIFISCIKLRRTGIRKLISSNVSYVKSIFSSRLSNERYSDYFSANGTISHPWRYWIIFIWLFAIGFLGLRYYENTVIKPGLPNLGPIIQKYYQEEVKDIDPAGASFAGKPDAKVRIIEFTDFECPSCRLLSLNMSSILLEYRDRAGFYFMNYPLDRSVNENVTGDLHKNAGFAALAGICAGDQGKFLEFQEIMFENQTSLRAEFIEETAKSLGLNMEEFRSCIQSDETLEKLKTQIRTGKNAGVNATPYLFINGRKVHYWNSPEVIRSIIEEELKRP